MRTEATQAIIRNIVNLASLETVGSAIRLDRSQGVVETFSARRLDITSG